MNILGKKLISRPFNRCAELPSAWLDLQAWYQSRLGQQLAEQEQSLVSETLPNLFGYHLLQLGRLHEEDWLSASRVSHCEVMDFVSNQTEPEGHGLLGLPEQLPIQTDCMDVIVLPHVLEFSLQPHNVLREAERVLIPEGHLLILVFNPFSLWTLWRWSLSWRQRVPWCGRFLSTTRIKDWLALLGFDVLNIQGYFFRPPLQQGSLMQRLRIMESAGGRFWPVLGAANLILARKRVVTLTPVGPRWAKSKKSIVSPGLVEPFQNNNKHDG
ncbi:MAG: methyltransferase domain-containing protein [Thioalkalispiraceae bacterium]|jgi:SAM-dependent methyltransferase